MGGPGLDVRAMSHPVIERRRAERNRLIESARSYVSSLAGRLDVDRAWVAGSVARGDFNVWSDVDIVVVAPGMPERGLERLDLFSDAPPRVQVIAYTPVEFERALARKDPLAKEATSVGVNLLIMGGLPKQEHDPDHL
jgi:predicted nucleotidyltransferase